MVQSFVKFAVLTDEEDVALFRQRQAQMYAGYHKKVGRLENFVQIGRQSAARSADGKLIFAAPLDYLAWTEPMARFVTENEQLLKAIPGIKEKQVWFEGRASPLARKTLERRGWKVYEGNEAQLLARI